MPQQQNNFLLLCYIASAIVNGMHTCHVCQQANVAGVKLAGHGSHELVDSMLPEGPHGLAKLLVVKSSPCEFSHGVWKALSVILLQSPAFKYD